MNHDFVKRLLRSRMKSVGAFVLILVIITIFYNFGRREKPRKVLRDQYGDVLYFDTEAFAKDIKAGNLTSKFKLQNRSRVNRPFPKFEPNIVRVP